MKNASTGGLVRHAVLALGVLSFAASPLAAQEGRAAAQYNLGDGRLAIQGYDPVSYFEVGGAHPRQGKTEFTVDHESVVYHFATAENRKLFEADPQRFEPAHGGWCAFAMSRNKQVKVDPEAFRIGEGRLLLFVDDEYLEFDGDWVPDEPKLLRKADANWKKMSGESPRKAPLDAWRPTHEWNLSSDALAIEGYDPVSYFPVGGGKPVKGKAVISLRHGGVDYRFASKKHRDAFVADPEKFEPQHGGWCSYAMGNKNKKVEVDPEVFRLTNGQLHFFYTDWFSDTSEEWDEDTANLKRKADANWDKRVKKAKTAS